jgi:cyclic pyranopterin phosphate synthase
MPIGDQAWAGDSWQEKVVTAAEIRARIAAALGELEPASVAAGGGPARYYRLPGAPGTLGFIAPLSEHFCHHCNRLRLTADGQLRPCLLSDQEIDLRTLLRQGAGVAEIKTLLAQGISRKPQQHHLGEPDLSCDQPGAGQHAVHRAMAEIGG